MILGNLNSRIGDEILESINHRFNEDVLNNSGEQLIQICGHNELRTRSTFSPHKKQHKYTFETPEIKNQRPITFITNRNIPLENT